MPATTVRAGERDPLHVLGMPLRFLCDARETGGAWSLFEEDIPLGMRSGIVFDSDSAMVGCNPRRDRGGGGSVSSLGQRFSAHSLLALPSRSPVGGYWARAYSNRAYSQRCC